MIPWLKKHFYPYQGNNHHPHILRHKSLAAVMVVVILIELTMFLGSFMSSRLGVQLTAVLPSVITLLTNDVRKEGQMRELETSDLLIQAAQAKAEDMATKGYFAHRSPDGALPWYWLSREGYQYQYAGENLAINFTDSKEVVKAWQNSPTHNLNLLGPRYTETGVGIATGIYEGREAVFVVQFFATPQSGQVASTGRSAVVSRETTIPFSDSTEQEVLGAETQAESSPSVLVRIISSPRTYSTQALLSLMVFFLLILLIGWSKHHSKALMGGVATIAIIAGLIFMNERLIFPELKLASDNQNAATVIFSQ